MPVEHDDEVTTFDPRPWGAMQRLLPDSRFAQVRTSGPLQAGSVAAIVPLPVMLPARQVSAVQTRVATATPPAATPVIRPQPVADLPLTAFGAEVDYTLRVRRRPLGMRSLLAVPLGAMLAAIVILVATSGSTAPRVAATVQMSTAPTAPVLAPLDELAATAAAEAQPPTVPEQALTAETVFPAKAKRAGKSKRAGAKAVTGQRPRKIVAGDTSTPLGDLRPGRF